MTDRINAKIINSARIGAAMSVMTAGLVACSRPEAPAAAVTSDEASSAAPTESISVEPASVTSDAVWTVPAVACGYLSSLGFPTGGYRLEGGDRYYCLGSRLTSSTSNLLGPPDEITYMPQGTANAVEELVISTEHYVDNPDDETFTLQRAAIAADSLLVKVFGNDAPTAAAAALRTGTTGSWAVGDAMVEVEREVYSTGRGYSMYFRIRKAD